jgi:mono/diheme cytochrome c family protein
MAIVFELLSRIKSFKKLKSAVQPTLLIGAITSLFSVATGLLLEQEGGYDEKLLTVHKYLGISTTVLSFIVYFSRQRTLSFDKVKRKQIRLILLIPVAIVVSLTGHWGGSLTHGEDYIFEGVEETAAVSQKIKLPSLDSLNNAVMYADVVAPILEAKCYSCHGTTRQKGGLRLDSKEYILRGGKNGDVVTATPADSSELYHRLLLSTEDKKHMPPKEKPQLSSAEIDLIHSWLNDGFSFEAKVNEFSERNKIANYVSAIHSIQNRKPLVPVDEVAAADPAALKQLADKNILIVPVAQGSNYLMANFVNARTSDDEALTALLPLKEQLVWLNLERTKVTDAGMKTIAQLQKLRTLYLNNTAVGDAGIQTLETLSDLSYLNVVGSQVTDQSTSALGNMKQLDNLYLGNTSISSKAIQDILALNKKINIDTGKYTLPALPSDTVVHRVKK